jgi:hypothetical protein
LLHNNQIVLITFVVDVKRGEMNVINYFKCWTPMRWVRLVLALLIIAQSIEAELWILLIPAVYLLLQAFFNFGCKNDSCRI